MTAEENTDNGTTFITGNQLNMKPSRKKLENSFKYRIINRRHGETTLAIPNSNFYSQNDLKRVFHEYKVTHPFK